MALNKESHLCSAKQCHVFSTSSDRSYEFHWFNRVVVEVGKPKAMWQCWRSLDLCLNVSQIIGSYQVAVCCSTLIGWIGWNAYLWKEDRGKYSHSSGDVGKVMHLANIEKQAE